MVSQNPAADCKEGAGCKTAAGCQSAASGQLAAGCRLPADRKTRIAVLVSGGGTNLQALIDAQKAGEAAGTVEGTETTGATGAAEAAEAGGMAAESARKSAGRAGGKAGAGGAAEVGCGSSPARAVITDGEIVLVIANNAKAYALERAAKAGIPSAVILRKELGSQEAFEAAILKKLAEYQVDFLVLAGFMTILSEDFTRQYENRIINVHPSLIPKYCGAGFYGLKVHEAVLAAGETMTGATVHYVNEIPDGGQIIMQKEVQVEPGDTPETLQRRVMEQAEWIILPQSAQMLSEKLKMERKACAAKEAGEAAAGKETDQ